MNYYKIALACLAALFISTPVMAKGGQNNCAPSSSQADPARIQNCLDRMNNPSSVKAREQQEKRGRCEQNAKNQDLRGGARSSFISSCMNKNEAVKAHATVAKDHIDTQTPAQAAATARRYNATHRTTSHTTAKRHTRSRHSSCVAQANKRHLKGSKRRHFLKRCR